MRVLVTGGAGFIGSWLVRALLDEGHDIVVVDRLSPQIHGALPKLDIDWLCSGAAEFIRADIRDLPVMDNVLARVDAVVHLAAETGTGQSMYQIAHYYDVNQQATASLFEAIGVRHRHIRKVILASSRSIYGEGAYALNGKLIVAAPRDVDRMAAGEFEPVGPNGETLELIATPETVSPMPASVYAATKLANETLGRVFADAYGVSVAALRFQNVYGERQSLRNPYTGILSIFSNRMRENRTINIFEDGNESRDFVHVSDVVCSIKLALAQPLGGFHALNVGSGVPTPVMKVAEILRESLESKSELIVTGDFRAGDIRHCYADIAYARDLLGFTPAIPIEEGLHKFVGWLQTQAVVEDQSEKAMRELSRLGLGRALADGVN